MNFPQQENSLKLLKAWSQIEEFNAPELPKKKDLLEVPSTEQGWVELSRKHKEFRENIIIYTCYLYAVPIKHVVEEFNSALKAENNEETETIEGETFVAAFRIYEDGCPLIGAYSVTTAFEKLQEIKSKKIYKPIGDIVSSWYQSQFHGKQKTITINQGTPERPRIFEIETSVEKFVRSDFSSFESVITEANPSVFSQEKISCLAYLKKQELHKRWINHSKVRTLPSISFCLGDIALAIKEVAKNNHGQAFKTFLQEDFSFKKVDLLENPSKMLEVCSPINIPAGRWPSDTDRSLYLAQQAAVNISINDLSESEGIIAINGPPGTGKTTLLREIIADIVVKRARRIASLSSPEDLFQQKAERGITVKFFPFAKEFSSCDEAIVVASTNNRAVENISKELPEKKSIHEDFFTPDGYFSEIAETLFSELKDPKECWGMISAPLGKKDNCQSFTTGFWINGLRPLLESNNHPNRESFFSEAKESFQKTFLEFESVRDSLQELKESFQKVEQLKKEEKKCFDQLEKTNNSLLEKKSSLIKLMTAMGEILADFEIIEREQGQIKENKPNKFSFKLFFKSPFMVFKNFPTPNYKKWEKSFALAEDRLSRATSKKVTLVRKLRLEKVYLEKDERTQKKLRQSLQKAKEKRSALEQRQEDLLRINDDVEIDLQFEQKTLADKNLAQPWKSPTLNYLRSNLFIKALNLHKATILYHREKFLANLTIATKVAQGTWKSDLGGAEDFKHLWASIFFAVPVVSTTLAAFERLFSRLNCSRCIGWILIDEAGQVPPQLAVGALLRAKRAIIIGDPMQIEPIRKTSKKLSHNILIKNQSSIENFSPHENSLQTIADRTSKRGTWIKQKQSKVWTGIPLRVHQRCRNPMFKISNEIAYGNQMVQGRRSQISPVSSWLGESRWYHVQGKTPVGKHGYQEELDLLKELLLLKNREQIPCYVITPFTSIKEYFINKLKPLNLPNVEFGTVHTFQGGEAHVVFLVLGGHPKKKGTFWWASRTPNLLNTAITRSKNYLYVIGNRDEWSKQDYFSVLAKELNEQNQSTANKELGSAGPFKQKGTVS